jgi:DNA-directed RNA polymerase specialized sigma54-like protein
MKLSLDMRTSLTQTLTPQQIQYLKLLQLPLVQLEQQIRAEIEQNPMLEEMSSDETVTFDDAEPFEHEDYPESTSKEAFEADFEQPDETFEQGPAKPTIDDQGDPFEFYKLIWQDDADISPKGKTFSPDEDEESYQIKDTTSFIEDILQQIRMLPLSEEEEIIGEQIIGNVDDDGYLRRDLLEIMLDTNKLINDLNLENQFKIEEEKRKNLKTISGDNPARKFAVSSEIMSLLNSESNNHEIGTVANNINNKVDTIPKIKLLNQITLEQIEKVLKIRVIFKFSLYRFLKMLMRLFL